jgi:hypothetical protein
MAGAPSGKPVWKGNHPVGQINAAPRFYRFAATGLGAAMWFFVSLHTPGEEWVGVGDVSELISEAG